MGNVIIIKKYLKNSSAISRLQINNLGGVYIFIKPQPIPKIIDRIKIKYKCIPNNTKGKTDNPTTNPERKNLSLCVVEIPKIFFSISFCLFVAFPT